MADFCSKYTLLSSLKNQPSLPLFSPSQSSSKIFTKTHPSHSPNSRFNPRNFFYACFGAWGSLESLRRVHFRLGLIKEARDFIFACIGASILRYEVVTAHMWRCASKARLHESEQLTSMRVAMGFHNRMVPPLPKGYFGNAYLPVRATTTTGELLSKPLGYGCSKIREAIEKVTDEYVRSSLAYLKREEDLSEFRYFHVVGSTQGAFLGNPNIAITSWIGLPLFGVDFGWGKEIYMGPGAIGHDGKSFILPSRDEDGSFDVPIRLQVEHMDAFKKYFYEHI